MPTSEFPTMLRAILENKYFAVNLQIRSELTRKQYRFALGNFEEFLGRPAELSDLNDDNVIGMMSMLLKKGRAVTTVNDRRDRITALWTWLCRKGKVAVWSTTTPLDEPDPDPQAWSRDEMRRLVEAAPLCKGTYKRKSLGPWWTALFSVAWDSGSRTGEILAMRWEWIDWSTGIMRVPANVRKGMKKHAVYQLKEFTQQSLQNLGVHNSGIIFSCGKKNTYYKRYGELLDRANIPRSRKNGLQRWRRSFATYIELAGGDATRELMHGNRSTTVQSYLDRGILYKPQNVSLFPLGSVDKPKTDEPKTPL